VVARRERAQTVCARDVSLAPVPGRSASPLGAALFRLSLAFTVAFLGCALAAGGYASAEELSSTEVYVNQDGSCTVLSQAVPCKDVGAKLGAAHVPLSGAIVVNASRLATYEMVAAAMESLQRAGYAIVHFPSK
jgi:hypothetical protein